MARLISLHRDDLQCPLGRRELPVPFDDSIAMVMKLPELNLNNPTTCLKNTEFETFVGNYRQLSSSELSESLKISSKDVLDLIAQNVPCVGCRRSVERLFRELVKSGQDALYPVSLFQNEMLGLVPDVAASSSMLFVLLHHHGSRLNAMVEPISTKSRQTRRCPLHSLEAHRTRATSLQWQPLWDSMAAECREELTLVEADTLLDTIEAYLQKHRFCPECRLKVLRAYSLLIGEVSPAEEKGYKPLLYLGLKCCPAEKHVHVQCNMDLISLLIARAEPELVGSNSWRERHAKTMEVAQEEVVTCVGICLLERLQRVAQRLREEERTVDLLQLAALQALRRSFALAVETKRGVSQLELLCEELSREEAALKQRKELKRLRRRKRRGKKDATSQAPAAALGDTPLDSDFVGDQEVDFVGSDTACRDDDGDNEGEPEEDDATVQPPLVPCSRQQLQKRKVAANNNDEGALDWTLVVRDAPPRLPVYCPPTYYSSSFLPAKSSSNGQTKSAKQAGAATKSKLGGAGPKLGSTRAASAGAHDSGYNSTNSSNLTTPEGSDVACTEGLCNHHSGSPVQSRPSPSPSTEAHDLPDLFLSASSSSSSVVGDLPCDCHKDGVALPTADPFAKGANALAQFEPFASSAQSCRVKLRDHRCAALSLQQMLENLSVEDEDLAGEEGEGFIPLEEVQAFNQQQQLYHAQRLQLRHNLRLKFDRLCERAAST